MELKQRERLILVKIVYYGPAVGGKTTNLKMLHEGADLGRRGDLVSVNSAQDRTILFDLLPIRATGFRGFELRLQLIAMPGQAMYAATRRLVLRGVDGVVFVANSAADRLEDNVKSYREMEENLRAQHLDPASVPTVLQYNKQDLPDTTPIERMNRILNTRGVPAIPAVTIRGEGVLETFSAVLSRTMEELSTRYRFLAPQPGQTMEDWTHQTIVGVFGKPTLAQRAPEPEQPVLEDGGDELSDLLQIFAPVAQEPTIQRSVNVALPPHAVEMAGKGPDARANETLVESYAQASVDLTLALEAVREERDAARRQVDDLRHTLLAVEGLLAGHPREVALRALLTRMTKACECRVASLVRVQADGSLATWAGIGIARDLFLTSPDGPQLLQKRCLREQGPRIHEGAEDPRLADVLAVATPPFGAVLSVPLRKSRLHALAMLYFTSDAPRPSAASLEHLTAMARPIAAVLERAAPARESNGLRSSRIRDREAHPGEGAPSSTR
jgi:signal recognition particle receptor subunit beta